MPTLDHHLSITPRTNSLSDDWLVYILQTTKGFLYTGITNNLERRCQQHLTGKGAKFFRRDPPMTLVWLEKGHNRASASRREYRIKKMPRHQKLLLVQQAQLQPLIQPSAFQEQTPETEGLV